MYGSFIDDWKTPDEYISKEAAEKAIAAAMPSMSTPDGSGENDHLVLAAQEMCVDAIKAVRDVPAADVAPVVHETPMLRYRPERYERYEEYGLNESGEMLYLKRVLVDEKSYAMYCPACGKRLCSRFSNYCPNCGVKMDGGTP